MLFRPTLLLSGYYVCYNHKNILYANSDKQIICRCLSPFSFLTHSCCDDYVDRLSLGKIYFDMVSFAIYYRRPTHKKANSVNTQGFIKRSKKTKINSFNRVLRLR